MALEKLAEEPKQGFGPLKFYHPEVREHFKRKLEKHRNEALELLDAQNTKKPTIVRL